MTLYNNCWLKRGVGLFSRVGLFSGDYGNCFSEYRSSPAKEDETRKGRFAHLANC